jgi:predicted anti-sigma-YlaC factor YlaD
MRCPIESQENLELLLDYGSSRPPGPLAAAFQEHLEKCSACREAVAGQHEVRTALDIWEAPSVSLSFNRKLYARIEAPMKWSERVRQALSRPVPVLLSWKAVPVAAAAGLVLVAGLLLQHPRPVQSFENVAVEGDQPEQVVHALDDMEMLDAFDQSVPPPGNSRL